MEVEIDRLLPDNWKLANQVGKSACFVEFEATSGFDVETARECVKRYTDWEVQVAQYERSIEILFKPKKL